MNIGKKLLFGLLATLLVLLPVQTLVTVWLTDNFGHIYIWSSWKEILVLLAAVISGVLILRNPDLRREFWGPLYNKISFSYVLLLALYLAFGNHSTEALVSVALHARFVIVFMAAQVLGRHMPQKFQVFSKLVLVMATASAVFGVLQVSILPKDLLVHIGYDPVGINSPGIPPAGHQVAAAGSAYRAQAGLRGPNALGAYLILPALICARMYLERRSKFYIYALVIIMACLYATYSRSAMLGVLLAAGLGLAVYSKPALRKWTAYAAAGIFLIGACSIFVFRNTDFVQSVVLHNNSNAVGMQSNEGHLKLAQMAAIDVADSPLGDGLGTAGPASALDGQAKIAENYFLQAGQEVGWLGIGLLLALHAVVLVALWRIREVAPGAKTLFLALIALTFTNLLLHTWTDEAVACTFWIMLGTLFGTARIKTKSSAST